MKQEKRMQTLAAAISCEERTASLDTSAGLRYMRCLTGLVATIIEIEKEKGRCMSDQRNTVIQ